MSDTGKTILWIVVAIVVIAVIIWLFVSAGRRREVEARRFEAGELRAKVEERRPEVQDTEDRASVTAAMAADARAEAERKAAEAEQKAAEARRLEEQAEAHRATAESARVEHAGLEREADRVDPDVATDDEGYRVDDSGDRLPGQEPRHGAGVAPRAGAAGAAGAGVGAAAFTQDDEEDDLADAENPFAAPGAEVAAEQHGASRASEPIETAVPSPAADERLEETSNTPSNTPSDHGSHAATDLASEADLAADERVGDASSYASDEPEVTGGATDEPAANARTADDDAADGSTERGAGTGSETEQPSDERSTTVSDTQPADTGEMHDRRDDTDTDTGTGTGTGTDTDTGTDTGARDTARAGEQPGEGAGATDGTPPVATIDEPKHVDVPALDDRDDVVTGGGTPSADPGDHRGQPWATTPGGPALDDGGEPADEGLDVDMAPHSHASDETTDVDEAVGAQRQQPRREEAEPAPDLAAAAYPESGGEGDGGATDRETDTPTASAAEGDTVPSDDDGPQGASAPAGRRISGFDEVTDGGFGLGSAAPIADGAQPLGHAVKGRRDGTTFVGPDDAGYDDVEPDVWFYNEEAARRAGFRRDGE